MGTWVISIDKDHPQHWDYAKKFMVWDLRTRSSIERGDTVYFWQAQRGMVGRGLVADDVRDSPRMGLPWDDAHATAYRGRIDFAWLDDVVEDHLRWDEIKDRTGITGLLHQRPRTHDSEVEARLAQLFTSAFEVRQQLPRDLEAALDVLAAPHATSTSPDDLAEDRRRRTLAAIRLRQGQPGFRHSLLRAYDSRCAVTGATTVEVLEAAHILPYMGAHTNVVQNGLLLRSDVHTLFDRFLLTIVPETAGALTTRLHPDLASGDYARYDGAPLRHVPARHADLPSPGYLQQHADRCIWL